MSALLFRQQNRQQAGTSKKAPDVEERVHIELKSLISLSRIAQSVPLTFGKIRALQSGQYHSPFKGRGMEFDEARLYQAGDDVRSIDWRVTARTGKPHTKLYREERERAVVVWVDFRAPMFFATQGCFKSVVAAKIASILSWSASQNGDRLGGLIFSETQHDEIRPQRGKSATLHLLQRLAHHEAWNNYQLAAQTSTHQIEQSSIQQAMGRLRRVSRPGSLVLMVSDFREFDNTSRSHLSQLAKQNDVVLIFVYDKLEADMPPSGYYRVGDGVNSTTIDTGKNHLRQSYQQKFRERVEKIESMCKRYRMSFIMCATDDDIAECLQRGLGIRIA